MPTPEKRLRALLEKLPPPAKPLGVYTPFLQIGNMVYVSGHGTIKEDGSLIIGRVGADINIEEAKLAARQVGLAILSTLEFNLGSLNRIERVIKVLGMVNCIPTFERHPYVINGCSELFREIFGKTAGVGVRSAVGMSSLPDNIPVEIEAQFLLKS